MGDYVSTRIGTGDWGILCRLGYDIRDMFLSFICLKFLVISVQKSVSMRVVEIIILCRGMNEGGIKVGGETLTPKYWSRGAVELS